MIGRQYIHHRIAIFLPHMHSAKADAGSSIAAYRFTEDVLLRDLRQLLAYQLLIIPVGGDVDILHFHQR